jgi:HD superfamily phosphohydrolase
MAAPTQRTYEFRCPVYGFVQLSDWEREIISQPAFQRLRRIRQLAWTDYVYPGAMHTRFEHVLGVMHMVTLLYDGIVERSRDILISELGYNPDGLRRSRTLVRLTALLHDIGHGPFSHAAEEVFPVLPGGGGTRYRHEHYSAAIVRRHFADTIANHPANINYRFTAEDVASLLEGTPEAKADLFWRDIISGQIDADRMDYLLRDSLHAGVDYGRYDWRRLVNTVAAVPGPEGQAPRIGVSEGGWHAAEALILARYFMFTQVYFHKTRVAYDYHLQHALADLLPGGTFPPPTKSGIDRFLEWDDWRVLGLLGQGKGGEHGDRIARRDHYRLIRKTPETPRPRDLERLARWRSALGDLLAADIPAVKSWYKAGPEDIPVAADPPVSEIRPLSSFSSVVESLARVQEVLLYVRPEDRSRAEAQLQEAGE